MTAVKQHQGLIVPRYAKLVNNGKSTSAKQLVKQINKPKACRISIEKENLEDGLLMKD